MTSGEWNGANRVAVRRNDKTWKNTVSYMILLVNESVCSSYISSKIRKCKKKKICRVTLFSRHVAWLHLSYFHWNPSLCSMKYSIDFVNTWTRNGGIYYQVSHLLHFSSKHRSLLLTRIDSYTPLSSKKLSYKGCKCMQRPPFTLHSTPRPSVWSSVKLPSC